MEKETLIHSIAYCGLICRLCFRAGECDGCKTAGNLCEKNCADEGRHQKACCEQQALQGCWECPSLEDCTRGIYAQGDESKVKAFALCLQQDGAETFIRYLLRNQVQGLNVEKSPDYDGKSIPDVLHLLRTGKLPG